MKGHVILLTMLLLVSCGKDNGNSRSSSSSDSNSVSAQVSGTGINFEAAASGVGSRVFITCQENGSTNRQRYSELLNLRNQIGTSTQTFSGVSLDSNRMYDLVNQALGKLYYAPLDSTICPSSVLGMSY